MYSLIDNSSTFLEGVDWPKIISELKSFLLFEDNFDNLKLRQNSNHSLNLEFDLLHEVLQIIHEGEVHQLLKEISKIPAKNNISDLLIRLEKYSELTTKEINNIVKCLEAFLDVYQKTLFLEKKDPTWSFDLDNKILEKTIKKVRRYIDYQGEIKFEGNSKISELYNSIGNVEKKIRNELFGILKKEEYVHLLQMSGIDVIDGHFVISVRTDRYFHELGKVISRSKTGDTVYVEPFEISELVLNWNKKQAQLDEMILKLCRELVDDIRPFLKTIRFSWKYIKKIDLLIAKSFFIKKYTLTRPKLLEKPSLKIKGFFHPLISNCIKNDIFLGDEKKCLVISGPNTGGKTIALKSICLAHLLIQLGLYVNADEAEMYAFQKIFYFSTDLQNIDEGLSSFSSEIKTYTDVFEELSENNIIFIDEIFHSTSSEEASALAFGFLKSFIKNENNFVLVSTHHKILKSITQQEDKFLSSHVGFNVEEERPTYHLHLGAPGSSLALTIFEKLTKNRPMANSILDTAKGIIHTESIDYEKLMEELAAKEEKSRELIEDYEHKTKELEATKESIINSTKLKMDEEFNHYLQDLKNIKEKAMFLVNDVKKGKIRNPNNVSEKFSKLNSKVLDKEVFKQKKVNKTYVEKPLDVIKTGQFYYSLSYSTKVMVTGQTKNKIKVALGRMNIGLDKNDLREIIGVNYHSLDKKDKGQSNVVIEREAKIEINCLGMRLDEFENVVDFAINDVILGRVPHVEIIHGHGNGVLKKFLRDKLKNNDLVIGQVPEKSLDGATQIVLKKR